MVPTTDLPRNGSVNGTHPAPDSTAWNAAQQPGWQAHEPPYLHSLKWRDEVLGIEHMTVLRADDLDDLWRRVRTVTQMIHVAKARTDPEQHRHSQEPAAPPDGWCAKHGVQMKQRHGEDGACWWSHKTADGWCKGKE